MSDSKKPLDDLFADMNALDTPEDGGGSNAASKPQRQSRTQRYRSALSEHSTDRRKTARATGKASSVAGKYIRRSFTYRPDQIESIEQLAAYLRLSKNDLMRWFVDMGVEAVSNGETPPITEEVRHRYNP